MVYCNKFSDLFHTQKRHPKTNMRCPKAMLNCWSPSPESLHQVAILFPERDPPDSAHGIDRL